jgi:hypothetical protein
VALTENAPILALAQRDAEEPTRGAAGTEE